MGSSDDATEEKLMRVKSIEAQSLLIDMEWKFREEMPPHMSSSSHDYGSNSRGLSPTALLLLYNATLIMK
ncbi:hypothetical protein TNCV_271721 [Trichonephila clavipes]|nr:hypothetical protein TNCV_271721 [Trichonephila clavipes]